jgi:hypothetical protein
MPSPLQPVYAEFALIAIKNKFACQNIILLQQHNHVLRMSLHTLYFSLIKCNCGQDGHYSIRLLGRVKWDLSKCISLVHGNKQN